MEHKQGRLTDREIESYASRLSYRVSFEESELPLGLVTWLVGVGCVGGVHGQGEAI